MDQQIPTPVQIQLLLNYCREFYEGLEPEKNSCDGFADPIDPRFISEILKDPLGTKQHNFHAMRIQYLSIDKEYPKAFRDKNGKIIFIQLREIKDDDNKLLIGCGNNPTTICYHQPIDPNIEKECIDFGGIDFAQNVLPGIYDENHCHDEYITMDPNPAVNPTIIGFFGWYEIPEELIKPNSLIEIVSEGISSENLKNFHSEHYKLTGYYTDFLKDLAFQ
jgi:hypothetical protein